VNGKSITLHGIVLFFIVALVGCTGNGTVQPTEALTLTPSVQPSPTSTFATSTSTPYLTETPETRFFEGRIAIAGLSRQYSGVRLLDLNSGNIEEIPGLGFGTIAWSPDYQWVAYTGGVAHNSRATAIFVSKPDGSDSKKYADSNHWKSDLSWSPDGKSLIFRYGGELETSNLAILNLASSETYLLTYTGYLSNPAWSPDGKQIAFMNQFQLWTMNESGSNFKQLIDLRLTNTRIDWSPDGKWLAFVSGEKYDHCGDIYIMKPDGSVPTRLTNLSGCATDVTWSPDGKHLAVVIRERPNEMRCQIYIMDAIGENLMPIGQEEELRIDDIDWGL